MKIDLYKTNGSSPPNQEDIWNSSITRVRPELSQLLERGPSGRTWLNRLIECVPKRDCPVHLPAQGATILSGCTVSRAYEDRVLKTYGISTIDLPECFEHGVGWFSTQAR